jgi:hypothetical protein
MKKYVNGKYIELTPEEITAMQKEAALAELAEKSRPLTESEVSRLLIARNINTVITDDATASRAVAFHPEMRYDGSLIPARTRINWKGTLKRSAVDIWDTESNTPDNAPTLWEDISYKDGFRIIPEVITATLAFSEGKCGWWEDKLYRSKVNGNVYTPAVYPSNWELVEM